MGILVMVQTDSLPQDNECIEEVEALFNHHGLLRYSLTCAPAVPAGAHANGYFNV